MTIAAITEQFRAGKMSAKDIIAGALKRAEAAQDHNVFLALTAERALEQAEAIDKKYAKGEPFGRLAGVPFVVKDNFLAFGAPTTAASKMLENFNAPFQATAVEKLEAEGAICIGKANLDAFAHGGSTENSAYGATRNAVDAERVAGGSSGGSAVAVALDVVPFALGTDTGGSIRQPASFNGVVGMKPTYGAVSRYGVVAMASSTDVIGPIARTVADVELVLDVLAGRDEKDGTSLPDFFTPAKTTPEKLTIGVIKEWLSDEVDPSVRLVVEAQVAQLKEAGHRIKEVSLPMARYSLAMYYIIVPAEISSNLGRYDGVRYGRRAEGVRSLAELYGRSRDEGFVDENKRRIMTGSYVLSSGYFDAYYLKAQKARTLLINEFAQLFQDCDVLVGPVAPTPAFKLGEHTEDPVTMYLADMMTVSSSLAGLPAVSVPAGATPTGLPVGLQIIGPRQADAKILQLAKQVTGEING